MSHPLPYDPDRRSQMWRLSMIEAPDVPVASVGDLQLQARTLFPGEDDPFDGAEDSLIARIIDAATQEVDSPGGWLGRSLVTRTLRLSLDAHPPRVVYLPGPPVTEIVQVTYQPPSGDPVEIEEADLEGAGYRWDLEDTGEPARIWNVNGWPSTACEPGRIKIDYVAGYGAADDVPDIIRHYILVRAATLYRDRESSSLGAVPMPHEHIRRSLYNMRVRL
jgi:uncharacterized phiE125 gp8 family phage protein